MPASSSAPPLQGRGPPTWPMCPQTSIALLPLTNGVGWVNWLSFLEKVLSIFCNVFPVKVAAIALERSGVWGLGSKIPKSMDISKQDEMLQISNYS
jgi:hypothetical protein